VRTLSKTDFEEVLKPVHKTHWKNAYKKLSRKMSSLKSSLIHRSEESNVKCDITNTEIRQMFFNSYGKGCRYCDKRLTIYTIACDHIVPLSKKGDSNIGNLQLICKQCNARKGPLDESDFAILIQLVLELPEDISRYVMKKLAKGSRYDN
jgi:5-methylcytosine-specific restriction endonuclease McrA